MATFINPPHPPPLPISKTCIYKVVGKTCIPIDVYLPAYKHGEVHPVMLFIHGGGWNGGNRSDYCRPLFREFLDLGFVVTSMDYRLRPETSMQGQLEDIRDVEFWLRNSLALVIGMGCAKRVDEAIVVVGASAGGHLALMTPKLWTTKPVAILNMYGPTNMHSLPFLQRGRFATMSSLPCTSDVLDAATDYSRPPTETPITKFPGDELKPRVVMGRKLFRRGVMAEFLIDGLVREDDGSLRLPEQGSVRPEAIDAISPLHICQQILYPPTYQVIGTADDVFDASHIHSFHSALRSFGIPTEKVIVPDVAHAFDIREQFGSPLFHEVIRPAVHWIAHFAGVDAS